VDCGGGQNRYGLREAVQEFLAGLPRRDLPVFFNSAGGMAGAASEIGASLREYRMSIGIGRTIPKGCDNASPVSEACRRLMQSKPEHQARLVFDGAWCASACVIAIAGGSLRRFDRATRLGIHALRDDVPSRVPIEKAYDHLKRYFVQMGVDPGIVDASAKISADSIHFLNASEILHFGLETPNSYETSWLLSRVASESYAIFKSVTVAHAARRRTAVLNLSCTTDDPLIRIAVQRESWPDEAETAGRIRMDVGNTSVDFGVGMILGGRRMWDTGTNFNLLVRLAAQPKVEIVSEFPDGSLTFSTSGLAEKLQEMRGLCLAQRIGSSNARGAR
jgi:hypothetical protein